MISTAVPDVVLPDHERADFSTRVLALGLEQWLPENNHSAAAWEQASKGAVEERNATSGAEHMTRRIDAAYDAWRAADAAAVALLREVREAWYRHEGGAGEPPSSELVGRAARLRHHASAKLAGAIQLLHEAGIIQPAPTPRPKRGLAGGLRFR